MVPRYDLTPLINVDAATLRDLTAYQVVYGFSVVRDYRPVIDTGWDEARDCLEAEARWLDRAARAMDAKGFDQVLEMAPEEEAPDDFDWLFRGNDVGVAGLVLVLAAAGYATCYSCRGHAALGSDQVPQVRLGCEPQRLQLLVERARRANCGVETDDEGLASVYAPSVTDLHALARLVLDDRSVFDTLPQPPWRSRALAALEQGEDFEWRDDELDE